MASKSSSVPYKTDESHFESPHRAYRSPNKSVPNTDSSRTISSSTTVFDLVSDEDQMLTLEHRPSSHRPIQFKLSSDHRDSKISSTLSFTRKNIPSSHRQDVSPISKNTKDNKSPERFTRSDGQSRPGLHSSSTSSLSIDPPHRLRTTPPVFHNVSDLAAHHGIPQSLPPAPRTVPRHSPTDLSTLHSPKMPDLSLLVPDYLNMLYEDSAESSMTNDNKSAIPQSPILNEQQLRAILDVIQGVSENGPYTTTGHPLTPIGQDAGDEFLTSPMESPYDDFLSTPLHRMDDFGHDLTSPLIVDDNSAFDSSPLFPQGSFFDSNYEKKQTSDSSSSLSTTTFDTSSLYMMSPGTPALDPSHITRTTASSIVASQRLPNGTRKNITPEALIPLDAPVQPRRYVGPSATSRKDGPTRKRARSQAFDDDDNDEDVPKDEGLGVVAAKRLQNTLAARRSRKRKLEYQRELENAVHQERAAAERWRARALTLETLLISHGIQVPPAF